ncbi:hypothetical protein BJF85_04070 [Saccharomonospora sp. CUA-673]|uniref:thiopeptide-type bacteriocin biosynthesis protein n=1 Tax=Saccharomonospora sp. CUA-673 TaxID=1904969 RepID=UPI00095E90DE|nr:thiopeptide-type bacteriocin biosynthesis protein [Saccharomonospora sp. CUA-673]OLT41625.1 hypothetical protein BJF85_04070 [Saccharomonospora sp. CUA-673]
MLPDSWHHYLVEFADPTTAEHTAATLLVPALDQAQQDGELDTWWHLRKTPAWRLRYQPVNPETKAVDTLLSDLEADGHLARWTRGIYEPETLAFGGPAAMDIAHSLFHHDSRHCLARATKPAALGQRETTVLLFSSMLRAAGLDWFEQGDVWDKVAALRPTAQPHSNNSPHTERLSQAVRRLMTTNTHKVADVAPTWFPRPGGQRSTRPVANSPNSLAPDTSSGACAPSWRTTSSSTPTAPVSPAPTRPPSPRWPSTPFFTARLPGRHQPGPPPTPLGFPQ